MKQKTNENLLYSPGNSTQCSGDLNGKEIQKRRDLYTCTGKVDSLCCTVETGTTLQSNYIPIKKIFFLKTRTNNEYKNQDLWDRNQCSTSPPGNF